MAALIDDVWLKIFGELSIQDQLTCASACKRFECLLVEHVWKQNFRYFDAKRDLSDLEASAYERLFGLNAASVETLLIGNYGLHNFMAASPHQFCFSVPSTISFFLSNSLPQLKYLNIDSEFMDDEMSALIVSNCTALKELKVTGSSVNATLIRQVHTLEKLYLPDSDLSGQDVSNLLLDLALTDLDVSLSMAGTNVLDHVGAQGLEMIGLSAFALDPDLPECMLSMSKLKTVIIRFPETGSTDIDFMDNEKWPGIFECIGKYVDELSIMHKHNFLLLKTALPYMTNIKRLHFNANDVLLQLPSVPQSERVMECHIYRGAKEADIKRCLQHFVHLHHVYVHNIGVGLLENLSVLYEDLKTQLRAEFRTETVTIHFVGPYDRIISFLISQGIWKEPSENKSLNEWDGLIFEFGKLENMMQKAVEKSTFIRLQLKESCM